MATVFPSLESVIFERMNRKTTQPPSVFDDEEAQLVERALYNLELNKDIQLPQAPKTSFTVPQAIRDIPAAAGQAISTVLPSRAQPLGALRFNPYAEVGAQALTGGAAYVAGSVGSALSYLKRLYDEGALSLPDTPDIAPFENITQQYTYQPRTRLGQIGSDIALAPIALVQGAATAASKKAIDLGFSPEIAGAVGAGVEIAAMILTDRAFGRVHRANRRAAIDLMQAMELGDNVRIQANTNELLSKISQEELTAARNRLLGTLRTREQNLITGNIRADALMAARGIIDPLLDELQGGELRGMQLTQNLRQLKGAIYNATSPGTTAERLAELGYGETTINYLTPRLRDISVTRRNVPDQPRRAVPTVPTEPEVLPPIESAVPRARPPGMFSNYILDAFDVMMDPNQPPSAQMNAARRIMREANVTSPGNLEAGLRGLGLPDDIIRDFGPMFNTVLNAALDLPDIQPIQTVTGRTPVRGMTVEDFTPVANQLNPQQLAERIYDQRYSAQARLGAMRELQLRAQEAGGLDKLGLDEAIVARLEPRMRNILPSERPPEPPPEPLPVEPTPTPTPTPTAPTGAAAPLAGERIPTRVRTPEQVVSDALDVLLSNDSTLQTRGAALSDLKREALRAVPGNVEAGLRKLGVEEQYIADFLPAMRQTVVGRPRQAAPTIPRTIVEEPPSRPVAPSEPVLPTRQGDFATRARDILDALFRNPNSETALAEARRFLDDTAASTDLAVKTLRARIQKTGLVGPELIANKITPEQQGVLDEANRILNDPNAPLRERNDARSMIQGIAERLSVKPETLRSEISAPATEAVVTPTRFQEYQRNATAINGVPQPDLVIARFLRQKGIELTEQQFNAMSAESSKIPQTPEALASYAQNYLRNHSTGLTEATAKLNDGNLSQPKDLTQQQRAEYVASGEHETIPYTYEQIKQNLENRVDISAELPPKLGELYRRALKYHTDQIETPNRRTYNQILRSIKNLVPTPDETTLGAFYPGGIGPEQRMAFNELKNDAIRFGKDIMQIIRRDPRLNEIQKAIYEEYNRSSQSPPPKPYMSLNNMGFDSEASLRGDFVIKRTKGEVDGTHRPEIYFNDWFAVASVDDLTPRAQLTNFQKVTRPESFQTLARKLLAAGQGDIVHAYRGVEQNLIKDRADYMKAIKRIRRQFSEEQQRAIGADMFLNEGSIDLLIESNVEPRPITAKELTVEAFVRGIFDDLFGRAQEVRSNTGRGPMDYVTHYITHMRATNLDEAFGIKTSIVEDTAALQNQRFANLKNTPFPMERTRRGGVFPAEMNVFDILENYVDYALRQIHLGPFVAKVHELIDTPIIDPTTGNTWRMSVEKPELYKVISEWNNHIAGKPEQSIPSPWNSILFSIGRSLGNSQIAGNISSIAIQPLGLLNTGQLYGYGRTIQATLGYMADLATPGHPKMKFRREHSKSLDVRNPDIYFDEAGAGVLENLLQQNRLTRRAGEAAQRASTYLGDVGTRGLRFTDQIAADISWDVGYDFALKAGKTGEAAFNIADDAVTLTQGSALRGERAPIQRKQWGRALTQFQTFAINNYDMITSQVLGIANKNMTNKQVVGNVLKFLGAGTILNFLMEDMGEGTSPLPNPPLAFTRTLLRGPEPNQSELSYLVELGLGSTLGEAAKIIPFASSLKVRGGQLGGPTAGFISSMGRALIGEEGTSLPRTVLRSLVPGGLQIDKMFFAPEKKNTQSFKSNRDDRPSLGGVR